MVSAVMLGRFSDVTLCRFPSVTTEGCFEQFLRLENRRVTLVQGLGY